MGRLSEPSSGASAPFGCRRPRSKPRGYSHRTHCGGALRYAEPGGWVLAQDYVVREGEAHMVAVPEVLQVLYSGALEVGVETVAGEGEFVAVA